MTYENIKLSTYLDITNTGNFQLLCLSGQADPEECFIAWEAILKRNGEVNGDFTYSQFFNKVSTYSKLLNDYQIIKAMLLRLHFVIDENYISYLRSKGYKIDVESKEDTNRKYLNSLTVALRKCENILTKLTMRHNELISEGKNAGKKPVLLEELIANISVGIGYEIKEDITLARYNEYKKIIVAKNKQHGRNKQAGYNKR